MRAICVLPGVANSISLDERPAPAYDGRSLLLRTLAVGICGTDREIIAAHYGRSPPGAAKLVLGHELLAEVLHAPPGSGYLRGDRVAGIVRRPDPLPCPACAVGEWDMCRNGGYTEHGIKELDGFAAEYLLLAPEFAVKVDTGLGFAGVLLEPASVVAKAWEHIDRIGARTRSDGPSRVLIAGAGPIGLLAALLGRQRGLEVHVFDRSDAGTKPDLARAIGARFHVGLPEDLAPDITIDCTGAPLVILALMQRVGPAGILCFAGMSPLGRLMEFDPGRFNHDLVLNNGVIFGSVNANRAHARAAAGALAKAGRGWLEGLITRRVPLSAWQEAYEARPGDIKVVLDFAAGQ